MDQLVTADVHRLISVICVLLGGTSAASAS